jgi:SAM-dependent methyltransferase
MTTERSPLDFYETNPEDIALVLPKLWIPRRYQNRRFLVIDLGCGRGAIGAAIAAKFPNAIVFGIELDPERAREARTRTVCHNGITRPAYAHVWGGDALRPTLRRELRRRFHLAIGNPPFSFWGSFGVLAEDVVREDGEIALLGPATVIEGNPNAHPKFPQQPLRWELFSRKGWGRYDCRKRPGFGRYAGGVFVESGTDRMPYAWFCKGGEHAGRWDTLERPPRKPRKPGKPRVRKKVRP